MSLSIADLKLASASILFVDDDIGPGNDVGGGGGIDIGGGGGGGGGGGLLGNTSSLLGELDFKLLRKIEFFTVKYTY